MLFRSIAVLVVVFLFSVKYKYALFVGASNIVSALITQLLKHTLFENMVRPKKFFEGIHDLYLVPGVDNYLYNTFPSGHTTCAFALYFALAVIVKNKTLKFFFFLIALLVGYSRIYLSQHFFEDVFAGSVIGIIITIVIYFIIDKINKKWIDPSVITSFKAQ